MTELKNLSAPARLLLNNSIRWFLTGASWGRLGSQTGDTARDLGGSIAEQFHTTSGAHSKLLESWDTWADRVGFTAPELSATSAKRRIELRVAMLNKEFGGAGWLPWRDQKTMRDSSS